MITPSQKLKVFVMTPKEHIKQIEDYLVHYRKNSFELSETKWLLLRVRQLETSLEYLLGSIDHYGDNLHNELLGVNEAREALTQHPTETE